MVIVDLMLLPQFLSLESGTVVSRTIPMTTCLMMTQKERGTTETVSEQTRLGIKVFFRARTTGLIEEATSVVHQNRVLQGSPTERQDQPRTFSS